MSLIELDCSSKVFYIFGNGIFYFLTYNGGRDIYSLMFSMTLTIIISLFLLNYDQKSSMGESINSLSNLLTSEEEIIEDDKIKVIKVTKKKDYSLGLNQIQKKCFSYGIIFLMYLILNIFPYINSLFHLSIYIFYEFLSLVAMLLTYYILFKEKLFRHHLFGFFFIILFSILILKIDFKKQFSIFSIMFYSYNGIIQCFLKIMMINYYVNPHIVSITNASMQILLDLSKIFTDIFILPNNNKKLLPDTYYSFSKYKNNTEIKKFINFVIGNGGNVIFNSLIVYYYPPFIYPASNDIGTFINIIKKLYEGIKKNEDKNKLIFKSLYSLGRDFGILILAEIIIFNFLGLGFNTKKNIKKRAKQQTEEDTSLNTSSSNNSFSLSYISQNINE
jgi:hypothetical protein